ESQAELGWAQGMFYNRADREIYVFNAQAHSLLMIDANTLMLKNSISGLNLSGGDCYIEMDRAADTIIVVSEAGFPGRQPAENDDPSARPIIAIERSTGRKLYDIQDCDGSFCNPGHVLSSTKYPLLYLGFKDGILALDFATHSVAARTRTHYRSIGDHLALT